MDITSLNRNFWLENEPDCLELLNSNWEKVPLLNCNDAQRLQSGKLVRFRGMIQDMYNPEYYLEKCMVVNKNSAELNVINGKYIESIPCKENEIMDHDSPSNVTSERQTFVMISAPGLNEWAIEMESINNKMDFQSAMQSVSCNSKRTLDEDEKELEVVNSPTKKQCSSKPAPAPNSSVSQEHLLNFPLPNSSGKACHIKIYDKSDTIKLNDLIEVVGFLCVDPIITDSEDDVETQTHNPPTSLIPRIHCVHFKSFTKHNYMGNCVLSKPMGVVFNEMLTVLTQLLLGDSFAAEYLIYNLISEVYSRQDFLPLGKFCLNLSNIPVETVNFGEEIYKIIAEIVPKSYYLSMTLENMNDLTFIPKKDYDSNRLTSGILQLSANTHLVLDETKLSTGKLNEAGVRAVNTIANAIKSQTMEYDFGYYKMDYECNIAFLIISEGKSMLPSDFHVPLKPVNECVQTFGEIVDAAKVYLNTHLKEFRMYLDVARRNKYELCQDIQESIQTEFVNMRQIANATIENLHSLLVLARLICLSQGKEALDEPSWRRACELETERRIRTSH
ncbi:PREDICTED: mini-chromosome maintenance complex-binding protein [Nicrophorus vespilloides]|uniref:Mini-chromosome maintenance complex-binding protein n=1 Tax=Nicrophorus vespilloides TaxID=110193 RepID=A0ABM1MYY1_NICVS|nr:PREDICTED: mini-chromosome maintenance complex-binding protein [Nicrophorus vespilloides]